MKQEFLKSLKNKLVELNLPRNEVEEIIADHEEMIDQAIELGLDEEKIEEKFGKPEDIAMALKEDFYEVDEVEKEQGYRLYKSFYPSGEKIEIHSNLVNATFNVLVTKVEQVELHVKNFDDEEKYEISFISDKLVVKNKKKFSRGTFNKTTKFKVYVPAYLEISTLSSNTVNGKIYVKGCNSNNLDVQSVNGNIHVKKCNDQTTKITTINGKINLGMHTTKDMYVSVVSGDGTIKNVTVDGDVAIKSVSGDINLKDFTCDKLNFNTVSGDLQGKEAYPNTVAFRSISGDVHFKNKRKDKKIIISKKKSLSGDINIES